MGVLRFWLDRGVDGFRIDVLWHIFKDVGLRDNPINDDWTPNRTQRDRLIQLYSTNQPEAHEIAAEFRALADSTVGDRSDGLWNSCHRLSTRIDARTDSTWHHRFPSRQP